MQLLIGTNNKGKLIEISEVLSDLGLELLSPADLHITIDPEETGSTFAENALLKAKHFYEHGGTVPTIADDSGIIIDALDGELGIHTRRWGAGATASDHEWIDYFLQRMAQEENRKARFVCNLAYIDESGQEHLFEGVCEGIITPSLEADYLPGLPISACFRPNGFDCVYSAMTVEQKNAISHRGRAVQMLRQYLPSESHP
ncbi:MAG: non-canonical purine NTP pyrophosphatase [Candidatus Peregrinibacteria bacterium]|nr:non-canonical purine NTP pyrophosphatase [Candidatus Peregrinibacteria bacterium]MCB9808610.1 non-canonical purine NTP pyrophosphatase [Candidatus Peribacteria bacterium]